MNSRINILNELRGISPTVASLPFAPPYQDVPAGYFDGLADAILIQVREDQKSDLLSDLIKTTPYDVPQGYFESFPDLMMQHIKASEEENINEELKILSPLLGGMQKKNTFHVPQGYFDDLSGNAIAGAKAIEFVNEELENLSPLMAGLKNKQVYEIPSGYFDDLPVNLLNIAKERPASVARVVRLSTTRRAIRYAVAAAVIGIVAISAWFFTGSRTSASQDVAKSMDDIIKGVHKLSDTELQSFVDDENMLFPETTTAASNLELTENDVKDLLADVSDEELQQYLDEESGIKKPHGN